MSWFKFQFHASLKKKTKQNWAVWRFISDHLIFRLRAATSRRLLRCIPREKTPPSVANPRKIYLNRSSREFRKVDHTVKTLVL